MTVEKKNSSAKLNVALFTNEMRNYNNPCKHLTHAWLILRHH